MKYFWGLLAIAVGVAMVLKTEVLMSWFGKSEWAEAKMAGSGGTRMLYKLIGIAIIFIAMMAMTGLLGSFILSTFGRLFGLPQ